MRPLKLKMNAFGPYREKVTLDFTKFASSSIFLVSGATGSGKTTIFDALTYALYNQASGDIRDVDMLKSQFATDEDLCFVELEFEMNARIYRIERIPKQKGPGKNGRVRNYPSTEVSFYREGELISTRIAETNEKIESLLGLTVEQFQQIVLLPQGEFRKLLLSSSRDKEEIFRNIFQTQPIEKFQQGLDNKRKELYADFKKYETKLEQLLSMIDLDSLSREEKHQLKEATQQSNYEEIILILKKVIQESSQQLESLRLEIEKMNKKIKDKENFIDLSTKKRTLEKQKEKLVKEASVIKELKDKLIKNKKASEVQREYDAYKNLQTETKKLAEKIINTKNLQAKNKKDLEVLFEEEKESTKQVEKLVNMQTMLFKLEQELEKITRVEKQDEQIRNKEQENKEILEKLKKLTKEIQDLDIEREKNTKNIEKIEFWREELAEMQKQIEKEKKKENSIEQEIKILKDIVGLQKELVNILAKNKEVFNQSQKAEKKYEEAKIQYFENLAGVLVEELAAGEPCPVCGSIDHPNPIHQDIEAISEEQLTLYEEKRNNAKNEYTKIATQVENLENQLINYKKELKQSYDLTIKNEEFQQTVIDKTHYLDKINLQLNKLEKEEKVLLSSLKHENKWRKQSVDLETNARKAELMKATSKEKHSALIKSLEELTLENRKLKENLTHMSVAAVHAEKEKLTNKMNTIQANEKRIQTKLSEYKNQQIKLETLHENLNAQRTSNQEKEKNQENKYNSLRKKYKLSEDFSKYIFTKIEQENSEHKIESYEAEYKYTNRQLEEAMIEFNQYEEFRLQTLAEVTENLENILHQKEIKEKKREEFIGKTSRNESSYQEISINYEKSKKISKPLALYTNLAEVANGSKRTNYISFERYVLSIYFAEILSMANERFKKMTNNRYELVRNKQRLKGRGAEGLDINVFDRYSGKERSVKSLSGGETFKASLALALGLSDVVQNQQGGVRVDTLFIDEGFGTLDNDSLEIAVETLIELQASGRLIGIISHVEELKNRIPNRIVVENKQKGSHARIEIN